LRLVYQGGNTLGQVRITIDNVSDTLDQSSGNEWVSDLFANGTHTVLITHVGGGSVNLDQVIIPEPANTPTPTRTATP
jgi:alkyl hydroperoxide reductase subunit AhpF